MICEHCERLIDRRNAHSFQDKEWWHHWFCSKECLIEGMLKYKRKVKDQKKFELALES